MSLPVAQHHVFVYGTLRPGGFYYRQLVDGHPVQATRAWTKGTLYALAPGYPGVTSGDQWVEGDVLSFDDDALLDALDELEGYDPKAPEAGEYVRRRCRVYGRDGAIMAETWIYWILPDRLTEYRARRVDSWNHLVK